MIQRIQTLYLLCAALFSGGLIFVFSLWTEKSTKVISALDLINETSHEMLLLDASVVENQIGEAGFMKEFFNVKMVKNTRHISYIYNQKDYSTDPLPFPIYLYHLIYLIYP